MGSNGALQRTEPKTHGASTKENRGFSPIGGEVGSAVKNGVVGVTSKVGGMTISGGLGFSGS